MVRTDVVKGYTVIQTSCESLKGPIAVFIYDENGRYILTSHRKKPMTKEQLKMLPGWLKTREKKNDGK